MPEEKDESQENQNQEDFYVGFKEKLEKNQEFPSKYIFKFIVPTDHRRIAEIQKIFDSSRPQFDSKSSKTNKYTSITVVIFALDAEQVIEYYKQASKIDDIIML